MAQNHAGMGFEIEVRSDQVVFRRRDTYGVGLAALISGGVLFIAGINAIVQLFIAPVAGLIIGAGALLPAIVFGLSLREYLRRARASKEEVTVFSVDLKKGQWCDRHGRPVAAVTEVQPRITYSLGRRTHDLIARIGPTEHTLFADYALTSAHVRQIQQQLQQLGVFGGPAAGAW